MNKTNKEKMLITGVSGMLGNNLARYFSRKYDILGLYLTHPVDIDGVQTQKADLLSSISLKNVIHEFDPDIIIHCASLTDIDFCETNQELTDRVNVLGTKIIVESIKNNNTKLGYISSDSVYDGCKGDFKETDSVNPQNYYGISKYKGELEALKKSNSLILRTNIFGWNIQDKHSIAEWILCELRKKRGIQGFIDTSFSSIYTFSLAEILDRAIDIDLTGIFNCGSRTSLTKYEFARQIATYFNLDKDLIRPDSIDNFNFIAKRGKNLTLNVKKIQYALNHNMPTIDESMAAFHRDFKKGIPKKIRKRNNCCPMRTPILAYGRQFIDDDDVQAVVDVLKSTHLTQGLKITEFESELSKTVGSCFAVAVNSGTSALHIACLTAGVKSGDEVITSTNTFVASANCAVYCGARPVFADIDPDTYNMSPADVEKKVTRHTKAIIPVDFAGQSCDMEAIQQIAKTAEKEYGNKIYIIEDACHALGSLYRNIKSGSCAFSDMTVMSFHPVKHITTGEGGVVLTNNETFYKKLRRFRSHGITNDPEEFVCKDLAFRSHNSPNPWYYEQSNLGYNYRITDIQCALGLSQLKKLSLFQKRRREIVNTYNEAFSNAKYVRVPFESPECDSNFHLYVLLFDFKKMGIDRAPFMLELRKKGLQTQVHYIPVHLQYFFQQNFGTGWGDCPSAEQYYQKCLSIPLYPAMSDSDVKKVTHEIKNIIKGSI